jgi:hypothetical protein
MPSKDRGGFSEWWGLAFRVARELTPLSTQAEITLR